MLHALRRQPTLADVFAVASLPRDITLVLVGSLAVGLLAQVEVRLPFTPVPMTLQPLAVFWVGAALAVAVALPRCWRTCWKARRDCRSSPAAPRASPTSPVRPVGI
jgi:hypothetical protein